MEDPMAAGAAPAPQTEATPITNPTPETVSAPAQPAVDMHGFTSEQLADMRKFYDANGGYDKVKSRISNPEPVRQPEQQFEPRQEQTYHRPVAGSITSSWVPSSLVTVLW